MDAVLHVLAWYNENMNQESNIVVSQGAAARVAAMRQQQGKPELMLRVTVLGGGCSGFKYQLDFDDKVAGDDIVFNGAVVTDEGSIPFLQNALIDYEQTLMGSSFKIKNPNAASGCGCGKSFSTKM
jgi:iron-sulfur cluster insertion protein